jgi:hypothetical protein
MLLSHADLENLIKELVEKYPFFEWVVNCKIGSKKQEENIF